MAFEQLFVRSKKSIGGIQLDAVLSENHTGTIRVTKNPIEVGADITDHAIIEPDSLTILAEVSDTPLGTAALGQIVDLVTGLFGTSTSQNLTRSAAAYNAMVQLKNAREPLEIQTKLKLYSNMLITRLTTVTDADSSRIVALNIGLDELMLVDSQVVQLTAEQLEAGATTEQATSPETQGRKEPVVPASATNTSVLKSVLDWVDI